MSMEEIRKDYQKTMRQLDHISFELSRLHDENRSLKNENKELKKQIEELKQDKDNLMKIAMKTPDSIAFPQMAHHIYFALTEVLNDASSSDEEKLTNLKTYLTPSLDKDTYQALYYVEEFQKEYTSFDSILNELVSWIKFAYKLN